MKRLATIVWILTLLGLLFSGYLSAVKLFTQTCAFGETCPLFLGYPACWFGFGMYLIMFVVTGLAVTGDLAIRRGMKIDFAIALLGILFSGRFVLQEISAGALTGSLGLSTCAYGLLFYIAIAGVAYRALARR